MTPIIITDEDKLRFASKLIKRGNNECWGWNGAKFKYGYGAFKVRGVMYKAHRISWFLATGIDPVKNVICHTCDNPSCSNPKHLFSGTHMDNARDKIKKGRAPSGAYIQACKRADACRGKRNARHTHPETTARGERQHMAKLTDKIVATMRVEYSLGGISYAKIASKYGITASAAFSAIKRESWAHVK